MCYYILNILFMHDHSEACIVHKQEYFIYLFKWWKQRHAKYLVFKLFSNVFKRWSAIWQTYKLATCSKVDLPFLDNNCIIQFIWIWVWWRWKSILCWILECETIFIWMYRYLLRRIFELQFFNSQYIMFVNCDS
jgi:hypothetical protein